jgi:hypothetical protein
MMKRILCGAVLAVLVLVTVDAQAARRRFRRSNCANGNCATSIATNSPAPTETSAPPAPEAAVEAPATGEAAEAAPTAAERVAMQTTTRQRRGWFRRRR